MKGAHAADPMSVDSTRDFAKHATQMGVLFVFTPFPVFPLPPSSGNIIGNTVIAVVTIS